MCKNVSEGVSVGVSIECECVCVCVCPYPLGHHCGVERQQVGCTTSKMRIGGTEANSYNEHLGTNGASFGVCYP